MAKVKKRYSVEETTVGINDALEIDENVYTVAVYIAPYDLI